MIRLTLSRVLWLTIGCLLTVTARTVWLLAFPNGHLPLADALHDSSLWVGLFVGAHALLFVEFALFAGSLGLYNRVRSGDLMPGWVLWSMALAMIFLAAGCFAAVVVPFVPVYPSWILCDALAAVSLGVSMTGYPLAMRRLAQRQPMTELEATVEALTVGEQLATAQQNAISELRSSLAGLSDRLSVTTDRADSMLAELDLVATSLEAVARREDQIYERISDARSHVAVAAQWADGSVGP